MKFEDIIKNNKQSIKNIVRLITKQDNEDVEQEVYIKLWKNSDKYEERGSLKSWINTIAKNTSKDFFKTSAAKREQNNTNDETTLFNVRDKKSTPEESALVSERQRQIINAIESLKPKLREAIMMCEIDGYSYEEAAKRANCPIGTIKSRIYNAKKELAEILSDLM